ncbi:hypothetical protein GCM10018783_46050 [Streptomyces griseosporeus]|nr:hypothetical protein GCM10018783_46050 [Streptomyces griseosporeus]
MPAAGEAQDPKDTEARIPDGGRAGGPLGGGDVGRGHGCLDARAAPGVHRSGACAHSAGSAGTTKAAARGEGAAAGQGACGAAQYQPLACQKFQAATGLP